MTTNITNGTRKPGTDIGQFSIASGVNNEASGLYSAAIGANNIAKFECSIALGLGTQAYSKYQTALGKYNELDANNNYALIVGAGEYDLPKNIFTLDWSGNATFAGNLRSSVLPSLDNDLISLSYFNKNTTARYFPQEEIGDLTVKIYLNDLDAYTSYKVRMDKLYKKIVFYIKAEDGSEQFLLDSDATINKYNMFVGAKLPDEMYFNINAVNYRIIFAQKAIDIRIIKTLDPSFASPSFGDGGSGALIDDKNVSVNTVYSSAKTMELLDTKYDNISYNPNNTTLGFYSGSSLLNEVNLNIPKISQSDIDNWNSIDYEEVAGLAGVMATKLDKPQVQGDVGQILTVNEDGTSSWKEPTSKINGLTDLEYEAQDITNAKEALDDLYKKIDELNYKAPSVSFTSYPSSKTLEVGQGISNITLRWTCDKPITTQFLDDIEIDNTLREYLHEEEIRLFSPGKHRFKLTIKDEKTTINKYVDFYFKYCRVWGVAQEPQYYNNSFIQSLSNKEFADDSPKSEFEIEAGPNQYIYYCVPAIWKKPIFNVAGFDGGFELVSTTRYENEYVNLAYDIYKSDYSNLGKQNIIIR